MSVTYNSQPTGLQAGFNEIEYKVSSNRNDRTAFTVTAISDNGSGKCRYAVSSSPLDAPIVQVGDVMLGSGFTETSYNVKQSVTAVNTTYLDTDFDFIGDDSGVMTRRNDNFKIKSTVYKRSSVWTAATTGTDGGFITVTSAIFTNISVGDHIFCYMDYTTDYKTIFKVTAVSGTTVTIDQTSTTGGITYAATSDVVGVLYSQSESVLSTSTFSFDISTLISSYLSADILELGKTNIESTETQTSIQGVQIICEELYENKNGLYITSSTSGNGDYLQVLNAVNQVTDTQSLARYILDTGATNLFLSEIPNNIKVYIDQELQLSFLTSVATTVRLAYRKYDITGSAGSWLTLSNVSMKDALETYKRGIIPINKSTVFDSSTSKVEVKLQTGAGTDISETKTFIIDNRCYESEVILEFKNRQGGFDSYSYIVTNETKVEIDRKFYKNAGLKSSGHINSLRVMTLESRHEVKTVFEWLEKLYESNEIYMINSSYTGGRVKVNLIENDYILNSQELFTSIIEVELQESKLN